MNYYKHNNKIIAAEGEYPLERLTEGQAMEGDSLVYLLQTRLPAHSRCRYAISDEDLAFIDKEDLQLLQAPKGGILALPAELKRKVKQGRLSSINTLYPNWMDELSLSLPDKWRINIVGLGDVGGTLATGLRLLGGDKLDKIGIYDIDNNKALRWLYECGQIFSISEAESYPEVAILREEELFDCDMFVFCVTVGVPPLDKKNVDVRMLQLEGNSKIVNIYAKKAREAGFRGIFSVVSDPVDLLCKSAFLASNTNSSGELDYMGLPADRIRGYGLGVMHARAVYYSKLMPETNSYINEGRAFGPHGEHLVIANSIAAYDEELSEYLTEKARRANLEVRDAGYKPYIAPALSSGSLSILATIRGEWHYSATYMGGAYMGSKNRLTCTGIELERLELPQQLSKRLENTYNVLRSCL